MVNGLRVLIVDGHVGPMMEASQFLRDHLHAQVDHIWFYSYGKYAAGHPRETLLPEEARMELQQLVRQCTYTKDFGACHAAVRTPRRLFFTPSTARAIEASLDLVLCQFPGWQCALFNNLHVPIAVRFTHRFQHHLTRLPPGNSEKLWTALLAGWMQTQRAAIFTDNTYDEQYLRFHIPNETSIAWPAVGARVTRPVGGRSTTPQWCFCCWRYPDYPKPAQRLIDRLRNKTRERGGPDILHLDEAIDATRRDAGTLAAATRCTGFLVLPHSVHSYAWVEAYAAGFPLVMPSPKLLTAWHSRHSLISHRCPSNLAFRATRAKSPGPDTSNLRWMEHWLSYIEVYAWPHVTILEQERDLPSALAKTRPAPRPEQHAHMHALAAAAAPRVQEALQRLVSQRQSASPPASRPEAGDARLSCEGEPRGPRLGRLRLRAGKSGRASR